MGGWGLEVIPTANLALSAIPPVGLRAQARRGAVL